MESIESIVYSQGEGDETKYYLKSEDGKDTAITSYQYNLIRDAIAGGSAGSLSETDILRLHQEQDPASPFYKGSESLASARTGETAAEQQSNPDYYELTNANVAAAEEAAPLAESGPTTFTTDEVTKSAAGIPAESAEPVEPTDESNTPAK